MSAPRLNRALVLEAPVEAPDGAGGVTEGWVALGTLWAAVAPRQARESSGAAQALATTAHRITVRAAPPGCEARPRPGQRFREGARVWRILAVAEADPEGRYLTCFAEEELAP
ncbi:head-tail adaptor protein [Rhodosalinus halophilus]|uniref:Head-tail adaptor protein n=1 Tax=Rhodosalinus halophilus TaxID=2259333 RepID=A0A365UFF2_9RHOB|nr:head-tail adaptor protein [Rhodosalinus halophilus]RBI87684.1 head-tail adaptor protein [Rhodosalinus halophilus]